MTIEAPETEYVSQQGVCCDGGGEHPRVWLTIPLDKGWVECSYCDKRFELKKTEHNSRQQGNQLL